MTKIDTNVFRFYGECRVGFLNRSGLLSTKGFCKRLDRYLTVNWQKEIEPECPLPDAPDEKGEGDEPLQDKR